MSKRNRSASPEPSPLPPAKYKRGESKDEKTSDFLVGKQISLENPHSMSSHLIVHVPSGGRVVTGAIPLKEDAKRVQDEFDRTYNLQRKASTIKANVVNVPIPNGGVLDRPRLEHLVMSLERDLLAGKAIYVHCQGGHGRTGLVSMVLLMRLLGVNLLEAHKLFRETRDMRRNRSRNSCPEPNLRQLCAASQMSPTQLSLSDIEAIAPTQTIHQWRKFMKSKLVDAE